MKDINHLVETTLKNLKKKNLLATPENYEKEFFELSRKSELLIEEQIEFDEIKSNLCKKEKKTLVDCETTSFKELSKILSKRIAQNDIKKFLSDLAYFMSPSLSNELKNDIDILCKELSSEPNNLINSETRRRLRRVTDLRIRNDKSLFSEKNTDVKKLILFLGRFFKKTLTENSITIEKIIDVKDDLRELDLSKSSSKHLALLHDKLLETVEKFEEIVKSNSSNILTSQKETDILYEQIERLKENLDKAEEEKSIDFLTGILTRRAYSIEIDRIENEYNVFDSNYAIVFYDIDYFKKINDTYGHDCGDKVLSTFASILNKLTRSEDIIARFGGEEFVSVIHYKNIIEVKNYLRRVKNIVSNNKFVYKDLKLDVKFSAGVTFRNKYNSYEETLKNADELLYKAKDSGRDKIILDNGDII